MQGKELLADAAEAYELGARCVFCDIEPDYFTMDPADVEKKIRDRERERLKEEAIKAVDAAAGDGKPMTADQFKQIVRDAYGV